MDAMSSVWVGESKINVREIQAPPSSHSSSLPSSLVIVVVVVVTS
jgi:hypothetical protein